MDFLVHKGDVSKSDCYQAVASCSALKTILTIFSQCPLTDEPRGHHNVAPSNNDEPQTVNKISCLNGAASLKF